MGSLFLFVITAEPQEEKIIPSIYKNGFSSFSCPTVLSGP